MPPARSTGMACLTMRATFPSAARLHRPSEYVNVLKGRRVARGALFVLNASKTQTLADTETTAETPRPRLGLIISKRSAPKAVTRNTIKRVIREAFRHKQGQLAARDYVFRLHSPVGSRTLTQLKRAVRAEADALLDKATL